MTMPETDKFLLDSQNRPSRDSDVWAWDTLTHGR